MAKNEFDSDFDYEKEYGFDPKSFLDSEFEDADMDFSEFDEEQLGLDPAQDAAREETFSDYDTRVVKDLDAADFDEEFTEEPTQEEADMSHTRRMDFFNMDAPQQEQEEIDDMTDLNEEPDNHEQPAYAAEEAED